jgi:hypothetical protein
MLLNSSLNSFLVGLGIYLGLVWTRNLDEAGGMQGSRAVFITYIIGLVVCYWVYALSSTVVADQSYISETDLLGEKDALQSMTRIRNKDEDRASCTGKASTTQHISSHNTTPNMVAKLGASTDAQGETFQERAHRNNANKRMSISEELAQVFQEAARLRKESAKIDERLAQLLENLGRNSEQ